MTKAEKLLKRFLSRPMNFTYHELIRLLESMGFKEEQGSGSRVVFSNKRIKHCTKLHKPHPGIVLKRYQIDMIIQELNSKNLV
jgi:predicted RNA binding protein YcfA (HicA-like mRNA interferase family)